MKTIKMISIAIGLFMITIMMSCENPIRMETVVHEDGSLDKTIVLEKTDSSSITQNHFGIGASTGWSIKADTIKSDGDKQNLKVEFKKSFASSEAINKELDMETDTLFKIHSSFDKSFRWFYTYIRYSETLRPIDRLILVRAEDYFNEEDRAFINRLPGEGTVISKADSIFLQGLNEKIFELYANDGLFNEQFVILKDVVGHNTSDANWLSILDKNRELIKQKMKDIEMDSSFAIKLTDSLGIKINKEKAIADFKVLSKDLTSRMGFMAFARDGKYLNIIEMPWTVVGSNADSVAGNKLFWRPLATKFSIQEYEMYAEARRLNIWAVVVSILIIGLTIYLFRKK
jgi:hypothetical protein